MIFFWYEHFSGSTLPKSLAEHNLKEEKALKRTHKKRNITDISCISPWHTCFTDSSYIFWLIRIVTQFLGDLGG